MNRRRVLQYGGLVLANPGMVTPIVDVTAPRGAAPTTSLLPTDPGDRLRAVQLLIEMGFLPAAAALDFIGAPDLP